MKRVIITAALLAMLGGPAHAKHRPVAPATPRTFAQAVAACRAWIRTHGEPTFDAFEKLGTQVSYFGTPYARFTFEKCMNGNGYPLGDIPPATATATPPVATPLPTAWGMAYIASCEKLGSHALCSCEWEKLQRRVSFEQVQAMIAANDFSPVAPIEAECERELANTF
jgi:hypothetical protein